MLRWKYFYLIGKYGLAMNLARDLLLLMTLICAICTIYTYTHIYNKIFYDCMKCNAHV